MNIQNAIDSVAQDQLQLVAIPIFLLVVGVEFYYDKLKHLGLYSAKDLAASLGMLLITGVVEFIPKVAAFIAFYFLHDISPLRDVIERQWWAWLLLVFMDDFAYYWFHRMNHEVRLFWAGHVSHHSSQYMNFGTALRQGAGERVHKYLFWLWIPILGFDPIMLFVVMSINLIFQFWIHTEWIDRFPVWVEFLFNTPSHHRVHHGSNIRYLDRNHGGMLIIWDRLFGTFVDELPAEPVVYGLTKNLNSDQLLHVAGHEYLSMWRDVGRATRWSDKLRYILLAPGWSHDGPDLRAKTLRASVA